MSYTCIRQNRPFKPKVMTRDKNGYVTVKVSIHQENITINTYLPKHIIQILTDRKGVIDSNSVIVEDFNIPLSTMQGSSREKISKETLNLNYTLP